MDGQTLRDDSVGLYSFSSFPRIYYVFIPPFSLIFSLYMKYSRSGFFFFQSCSRKFSTLDYHSNSPPIIGRSGMRKAIVRKEMSIADDPTLTRLSSTGSPTVVF